MLPDPEPDAELFVDDLLGLVEVVAVVVFVDAVVLVKGARGGAVDVAVDVAVNCCC